jgi:hypothetical protein
MPSAEDLSGNQSPFLAGESICTIIDGVISRAGMDFVKISV